MNTLFNRPAWLCLALGALACTGCTSSLPPVADASRARAAMEAALDTWQRGESPQTLAARTPPIQFADLHWDQGYRLMNYEIASVEPRGLSLRLAVRLSLQGKDGAPREATTVYMADTEPRIVIVPEF